MIVLQNMSYWKIITLSTVNILVTEEKNVKITHTAGYKQWKNIFMNS